MEEFLEFPKIARLSRDIIITEKIDGTNAQIYITDDREMYVGSRTRWIQPGNDNFGFAKWAEENKTELLTLGPGHHFGEWWGSGIQRGYNLPKGEKRFSLFNTIRWALYDAELPEDSKKERLPKCVGLVPVLFQGDFNTEHATNVLNLLKEQGSYASPGFMKPEGIVIYHTAANICFKKTIEKDESPKTFVK